jgi:hypothetical protein
MGRPKAIIDWNKVDKYLQAQCDGVGIAGLLGVDVETFYRRCKEDNKIGFSEYSSLKKAEGVELLRAKQFEMMMKGNTAMAIWLGKQYAGQKDKQEVDNNVKGEITIIRKVINGKHAD